MRKKGKAGRLWAGGFLAAVAAGSLALGQQVLQHTFESRDPIWVQGPHDANYQELAHRLTDTRLTDPAHQEDERAHGGQRAELISLSVEAGSFIHYTHDIGRAPVNEDLTVSLWVCANRPGTRLLVRVVLPRERDPARADQPLTVLLPGDTYQLTSRWQQMMVREPVKLLSKQVQLLRANLKRDVSADDAYVDQLVLNVYSGPGETKVWTDDLEVGPVLEVKVPASPAPGAGPSQPAASRRAAEVQLRGKQLLVSGQRFFMLGIRHTGTPLKVLRDAGFNTVMLDETTPPGLLEDAVNLGFWVVPTLSPPGLPDRFGGHAPGQLTSRGAFEASVARFLNTDAVLAWDLGGNLGFEQSAAVARAARAFRDVDPLRPMAADVSDGLRSYTVGVDQLMVGVHRWPLLTTLDLAGYREWLEQRRRLVAPDTFCWTWIQTHLPDWYTALVYEKNGAGRFDEPIGPQPEQIRVLAYTAVGCGYRGLAFWSDRFLADSHGGRDRLLALALLNQELQMLEPLLVGAKEPVWIETSRPEIKAAVLRTDKGVLVLPVYAGKGGQFVPAHAAAAELSVTVPQVPATCQAWEVSPGRLRSYKCERVLGGTKVSLHDFSLTAALVFTADLGPTGLIVRFQEQQRRMRKLAAQWSHDLAEEELAKAERVQAELEQMGRGLPDGEALVGKAREWLDRCKQHRKNGEYGDAYGDAQVALQAVRLLMRAHWDQATRGLDAPVSSPYAVSFYTLPRHYAFVEQVRHLRAEGNALPDGDFEAPPDRVPVGWMAQEVPPLDEVEVSARRVADAPHGGRQCLMLKAEPKNPQLAPQVLERTFLAIHSPAVRFPPGTVVRVSAWVRIPDKVRGSADGALIYDSAGGEPLAVRLTEAAPGWKQYSLFRRVPASGTVNATLALTGLGTVYFDDVCIEALGEPPAADRAALARP
jgi:hypothetical protein